MTERLDKDEKKISGMFDSIASKYDRMNHGMSLGIDRLWRRRFVRRLAKKLPEKAAVLDLACGTGDLTKALSEKGYQVTGLDISSEMMAIGREKCRYLSPKPNFVLGSAEQIPFPDDTFDAVTIAFGLRNFDHRARCLAEIRRVLKPGGQLAVLEFAVPRNRHWNKIYLFYFKNILPLIGRLVGSADAYGYLVDSVLAFPRYEALCDEFRRAGFLFPRYKPYTGGIACAYFTTR
ncbi:MAG: bifunctional demethylmenaquinone methyltransferase/2-methoxy-6-polyprenyl-1,4-benzoquinol methylase UbiE [Bacteroidales bacterium]|nr:bifunctional demethylmenaquinone methyltransferase/2-methoxy-6-polyprenyl-1,4-benzoquinol methylase UbiE [Bacteroidales bacterium]